MRESKVGDDHKGKGYGKALYLAAIKFADDKGASLSSDKGISADADHVWQSLQKMGLNVVKHPNVKPMAGGKLHAHQDKEFNGVSVSLPTDEPVWTYAG